MGQFKPSVSEQHQVILDSLTEGVFTVDLTWRVTSFNKAAERLTGIPRGDAIGQLCHEVFRANVCETACVLRQTMKNSVPIRNMPIHIIRADERQIPISVTTSLLKDAAGQVIGGVETFRDLSTIHYLRKELQKQHSFLSKGEAVPEKNSLPERFTTIVRGGAALL
jgi:PAS domain S-box-containing protein